jgi:phenylacetate-coenzyme A ligase PaaK-like adenylate-forming protein
MTLISGIPPWVQMYFDKLSEKAGGKPVKDIYPNFNLFVFGGVNFEPYRAKIEKVIGKAVDTIETYPASEGFIAYQNSQKEKGLLLLVNNGIFYEFIPTEEFFNETPTRISLKDVQLDKNYAIILNTNAGLYGYNIGDTVKFVSKNPYKLVVTGRIKHYISAFGEHVIGEEVEHAILSVAKQENVDIIEFTVAPMVNPKDGLPYHEWFVEFGSLPE